MTVRSLGLALCLVLSLAVVLSPPAMAHGGSSTTYDGDSMDATTDARIVALHPNPVADGDRGEFVALDVPADHEGVVVTDGESEIRLAANVSGRVLVVAGSDTVVSDSVTVASDSVTGVMGATFVRADGLALANGGERVWVRDGNDSGTGQAVVHDSVTYGVAPEGDVWHRAAVDSASGPWRPLGATQRRVTSHGPVRATAFVLPDSPGVVEQTLQGASERILLAGYTLTSAQVAEALVAAHRRGVKVRVLVEGGPVGGVSREQAETLDRLVAAGIDVRAVEGPYARVSYHHAKYAVVDDRALVLSENWKPAGTGGAGSRGWGVRLDSASVAADLAGLFEADAGWRDAITWSEVREGRRFEAKGRADGSYPTALEPRQVVARDVRILTAPDNAEGAVVAELDDANETIDVLQPTVERDGAFVGATIRAAERGVRVRILLSDAWYVAEENREIAAALTDYADRRDLPLSARLADPGGRYEKVHAKGVVIDGETVLVGSLNWNSHAVRENREVVVALDGGEAAGYYTEAFEADWQGGGDGRVPAGLALGVAVAVGIAIAVARREVRFDA